MTDEEKKFRELCGYVKNDIMKYDSNQKLSEYMILRLRGLKDGKFIANNNIPSMANYSYDVILLTFKYVKQHNLDYILSTKKFDTETKKFNYILAIVSNNINSVYNKVKQIKEEQSRAVDIQVDDLPNYTNKYETKKINNNLEKFW